MSLIGERSNPASQLSRVITVFNNVTAAAGTGTYIVSNGGDTGATASPTNLVVFPFQWAQIMVTNKGAGSVAVQLNLNRVAGQDNTLFTMGLTALGTAGANSAAIIPVDSQGIDIVISAPTGVIDLDCTMIGIDNPSTEYEKKVSAGQQAFINCANMSAGGRVSAGVLPT